MTPEYKAMRLVATEIQRSTCELLVKAATLEAEEYAGESTYARGRRHRRTNLLYAKAEAYQTAANHLIDLADKAEKEGT